MKIAIWHNLPSGGGNRALHDQVRGLVARGHRVEIWCPPTANRTVLPLGDCAVEHVLPLDGRAGTSRSKLFRRTFERLSLLDAMDRHCRECAAEIDRGGFDVLLAHASQHLHPTSIGRHSRLPSLIYLQEPNRGYYEAMPRLTWVAPERRGGRPRLRYYKDLVGDVVDVHSRRVVIREELASAAGFGRILVNSLFSRESILRSYGLDARVCYLGIDVGLFRPAAAPKRGYVVGLGNLAENKRPDLAIRALGTIAEGERPELVWVGNYASEPYLRELDALAAGLGVRFRTKVNIPNAELVETLAGASAMIYTSRLEPFGYAPLEANACGTAVVGVAEGGIRETVRDGVNGTLVADADPAALGRAVMAYCGDPARALEAGRRAREEVERRWTLDASIDRLESYLAEVAAPTGRPGG